MQIKTFKAPTLKEAMAIVKAEMGADAVILHTSKTKKGGILGFGANEIVEVVAAIEDKPEKLENSDATEAILQAAAAARSRRVAENRSPAGNGGTEPTVIGRYAPRNVVSQYQTAGTIEGISQAMAQSKPSQSFGEVLNSVNQRQEEQGFTPEPPIRVDFSEPLRMPEPTPAPVAENVPPVVPVPEKPVEAAVPVEVPPAIVAEPEELAELTDLAVSEPEESAEVTVPAEEQPVVVPESEGPAEEVAPLEVQPVVVPESQQTVEAVVSEPEEVVEVAVPVEAQPVAVGQTKSAETAVPEMSVAVVADASHVQTTDTELLQYKEEEIQDLQSQIEEMKALLVEMSQSKDEEKSVPTLQAALQKQEVSQNVLNDMISKLNGTEILAPQNSLKASKALERYIRKAIRMANGITLYSDKPKIVALIGPTGVGKTTTLAKIAARFVLEQGIKVALVTADTYRISAVEQLKTYSDILGLPLEIVYSPDALKQAIAKHRKKQLILLDTAGRSQYNAYQMKELSELLRIDEEIETHLVISATTKTTDGLALMENFSMCNPDRVIFTKVDETSSHGIILNMLHRRKVALSYLTNGQSVPDDIEPASVERLAGLLLR